MPDTNDLLEQFRALPPERRKEMATSLLEALPFSLHPTGFSRSDPEIEKEIEENEGR